LSIAEVCFQATFHLAPIGYGPAEIERIYSQVAGAGLSVATIGEITGIPRETVRRKVKSLVDEGYLATSPANTIYLPLSAISSDRVLGKMNSQFREASEFSKTMNFYHRPSQE
jgi:DNA-binding Lrp family transcriptional regulator